MPAIYEGAVQDLIDELGALPGIGPKSAQRIAFHPWRRRCRRKPVGPSPTRRKSQSTFL